MSKETIDLILAKLQKLEEYLGHLKELRTFPKSVFIKDYRVHGLVERYLQLSIEVILDIGRLLLIEKRYPKPENNHEIFEILHARKVMSKPLYARIKGIAGFRNILVHDYMKIDRAIVFENFQSNLKDFSDFIKMVRRTLKRKKPSER